VSQELDGWTDAGPEDEVPEGDVLERVVGGQTVALYKLNGKLYATSGLCTHERVRLCLGLVDGDAIECPKHNARFHIPTGKALRRPATTDLPVYAVRTEAGRVLLKLFE
jgi:nitrite reductase/ring-hydroxylating ferredoxin subunit